MLGEVIFYQIGKARGKKKYKSSSGPANCLVCNGALGRSAIGCGNIEEFCIECCQCTEHS